MRAHGITFVGVSSNLCHSISKLVNKLIATFKDDG